MRTNKRSHTKAMCLRLITEYIKRNEKQITIYIIYKV